MNFIEISTPRVLYGLLKQQITDVKGKLAIIHLSESDRLQLLGEHKALTQLLISWLQATEEVEEGFVSDKKNKKNK